MPSDISCVILVVKYIARQPHLRKAAMNSHNYKADSFLQNLQLKHKPDQGQLIKQGECFYQIN